ncbi:MAG: YhjD/YihY/BrkB family envelope integrity protein [Gaiellaceae bacterium]
MEDRGARPRVERRRSRRERARERQEAIQARMERLSERAQEERGRRGWVDAIFEVIDRDGEVAGGIIAGALAYRLFIWLLPFGLVFVGGLGVIADALSDSPNGVASNLGIAGIVSNSLASASNSHSPWYALIVGVPILLYATRSVLRVLIGTHRLAWGDVREAQPKPTFLDAAKLLGVLIGYFVLAGLAAWARAHSHAAGLVTTIVVIVGFIGLWLWTSTRLPHSEAGWMDLVPGAIAVGIGVEILQVAAAYLLAPYALEKQGTYGALGLAAALLLGLWVLGRLLIGGAEINATLWERKRRESR